MRKLLLCLMMLTLCLSVCDAKKNSLGKGVFWEITNNGTLNISGNRAISDDSNSNIIYFDYYTSPTGTKNKGKYKFSILFKSDAIYFKLTNEKGRSNAKTIYNFKLKELYFSENENKISMWFKAGNKSHEFIFKKGYFDPAEHIEVDLITKKKTITSYSQETKDASVTAGLTMLLGTTPTELFFDNLFENLCFYQGDCKITVMEFN